MAKRSTDAALSDLADIRQVATADVSGFVDALVSDEDSVAEETARQRLEHAAGQFRSARAATRSPVVTPLRALPVLGRQIRSFDALAKSAAIAAAEGGVAVDTSARLLEGGLDEPDARLAATSGLGDALQQLRIGLADVDLGPSDGLVDPLRRARNRFEDERARALVTIDRSVAVTDGLTAFLTGPSDYLVLAANNAEMQAGSAMYLQVGVLHIEDGRLEMGDLVPSSDLYVDEPSVPIDPDIEARWGALRPNQEWRNLNLSPRFEVSAAMAAGMWSAGGGEAVDGVLAVDIAALEALLKVTGPIEIDGEELGVENVAGDLMLDQYIEFEGARDERRDRLGRVAQATFDALDQRQWSPSGLLRSLQSAGEGRHFLAWSPEPIEQRAWEALGIDGKVGANSMMLSLMNRGGNKLDPYLDVTASLAIHGEGDGDTPGDDTTPVLRVRVDVTIANSSPEGLPRYVAGPHPRSPVGEGTYRGFVSLTIPGAGGRPQIQGGEPVTAGDDGATRVLVTSIVVERDDEIEIVFTFDLPADQRGLVVESSARLPATEWRYRGQRWDDDEPAVITLEQSG